MDASVIIPALNARSTIERAVQSAADQTLRAIEIIVVDDGSDDGTAEIVTDLCRADPRIKLIRQSRRRGVSAARNCALQAACGEWIAVLDADDWFAPERLANLIEHGRAHRLDAVIDNLTMVDGATGQTSGNAFPRHWLAATQPISIDLPVKHDVPYRHTRGFGYCKPVFRTVTFLRHVGAYDVRFQCGEDLLALQLLLFAGALVGTVESAGYFYNVDQRSLSNRPGADLNISNVNRLLLEEAQRRGLASVIPLLKERQIVIDYDAFAKLARQRRLVSAFRFLRRLPPRLVATQLLRVLGRRFGLDLQRLDPRNPNWPGLIPSRDCR